VDHDEAVMEADGDFVQRIARVGELALRVVEGVADPFGMAWHGPTEIFLGGAITAGPT
jgi:hypothetical protein